MADAPIGIFDSGFGGLTVARAVLDQLPHEPVLYLGDTARQPYGDKPIGEVREYALECLDHLVDKGVKALVIACNSASAAVLRDARERYPVPVAEVIFPATRRAVAATRNNRVGVICTQATESSMAYDDAFAAAPQVTLTTQACPRFVELVERGVTGGPEVLALAHHYLDPLRQVGIDTLILGCTHYPLLTGVIAYVLGDSVTLVSSAEETAKDVYALLQRNGIARSPRLLPPEHLFLTTGQPGEFREIGQRFLGPELDAVDQFRLGRRMKLTVVGCSGSLPGPDSPASCYLLEAPYEDGVFRLLLDLGSGAIGALQQRLDLRTIGAVAFTHLHADHCLDLCGFFVIRKHHPDGHWGSIPAYGPPGVGRRMAAAYDIPPDPGMSAEFDFREYDGKPFTVGPFTVETAGMDHPVDAYALRVSADDRTLVYSGDSAPCDALDSIAKGADLLLVEASFLEDEDNPEHLHLTGPEAAQVATRAGAGRVVLTHVPPWYDRETIRAQAAPHFAGPTDVARPGLTITL